MFKKRNDFESDTTNEGKDTEETCSSIKQTGNSLWHSWNSVAFLITLGHSN